jgi:penicillin G amidase
MTPWRLRSCRLLRAAHAVIALAVSAGLLVLLGAGFGVIPALGPALVPGHGAWTSAAGGMLPESQTLTVSGLASPVRVWFTAQGVPSIRAASDGDLFLAQGYVQAEFRLTEMDLVRRLAEGRLAQLVGPAAVASDEFELRLGLLRTAQQEWAQMPRSGTAARALIAYSRGVNDYLAGVRASGQWPALFSLARVYPAAWTPVDSLLVQGFLTQELDFTTVPLDYALLERSLGAARTMQWFPVLPPNRQSPYDPGPYRYLGVSPIATGRSAPVATGTWPSAGQISPPGAASAAGSTSSAAAGLDSRQVARAAAAVLADVAALPAGQVYADPDSNAWAVNGPKVAGGGAMLAGDPHVLQSLPSIWYQVALSAPGLSVSGVSVAGMPGVLIGYNSRIAWSETNTQNQATLFYVEQTSKSRPGEYFWRGQWRRMRQLHYTIPVRGGASRQLTVDLTVHGPILTRAGQTVAVDWMGSIPSPDLAAILAIDQARDFSQFRAALASWHAPTENFVYADDRGNIGAISAGYYPLVRHGDPWLPLPGTGADDVAGVIPYAAVPQVYDPPGHVVATANQRPVAGSYPYYIGTSADFFDPGYRADEEYAYLGAKSAMRPAGFAALQTSLTDQLAGQVIPQLLAALRAAKLTPLQQQAERLVASWNDWMGEGSAAGSIWWTFWTDYLADVFQPWWTARKVPVHLDRSGLQIAAFQVSLDDVLEAWTLHDQHNPAFSPPGTPPRDADTVMVSAFGSAVRQLQAKLGGGPAGWAWGKLHRRQFPSVLAAALGYGPRPAGGDPWTVDAAEGGLTARVGPSWRMIVSWHGRGRPAAEGILSGGQSENPASPWYQDQVADWWAGRYLPMPPPGGDTSGSVRWVLKP